MKKQDGYILVFALVVLLVVDVFVLAISAAALRSFKYQTKTISAMQEHYAEEGTLQAFEGNVQIASAEWDDLTLVTPKPELSDVVSDFLTDAENTYSNYTFTLQQKNKTDPTDVILLCNPIDVPISETNLITFAETVSLLDAISDPYALFCDIVLRDIYPSEPSIKTDMVISVEITKQSDSKILFNNAHVTYESCAREEGGA